MRILALLARSASSGRQPQHPPPAQVRYMPAILKHPLTVTLGLACAGLLVLCGMMFWELAELKIRMIMAREQAGIIEDMRLMALEGDRYKSAGALDYAVHYYPSGTKQVTGSHLDHLVEQLRSNAVREIIAGLKSKTGEDLGEQPDAWIRKYGTYNP